MATTKKSSLTWFALVKVKSDTVTLYDIYKADTREELKAQINGNDQVESVLEVIRGQSMPVKKEYVIG